MNMILRALMVSVWFMALTFPLVVLKVDALNDTILFRWENMASIGVGAFVLSIFWRWSMERKARGAVSTGPSLFARALEAVRQPKPRYTCLGLIAVLMLVMPYISSMYQINIMISALIYIMLGLGLNIVVGLAGQLVLGYAAFYAPISASASGPYCPWAASWRPCSASCSASPSCGSRATIWPS